MVEERWDALRTLERAGSALRTDVTRRNISSGEANSRSVMHENF